MQDRRNKMAQYIEKNREVSISQLSELFPDVSEMTIRRDLEYLEQQGTIVRVKGGAKSVKIFTYIKEAVYSKREISHIAEKEEIAKKACAMVESQRCVYFDPGTTVMAVARGLSGKKIFAVTSGPNIAMELAQNSDSTVNIVGGELSRENLSISGQSAVDFIDGINIELAFIAASGYTEATGFTCGGQPESILKKKVISRAARSVVIMDSSKDGTGLPYTFAFPEGIDTVISDSKLSAETKKYFEKKGVTVI